MLSKLLIENWTQATSQNKLKKLAVWPESAEVEEISKSFNIPLEEFQKGVNRENGREETHKS